MSLSGGSYGSLELYIDTWNNADMAEVTSTRNPHPAGPSVTAQRMFEVEVLTGHLSRGVQAANEAAKVTLLLQLFYLGKTYASPQSPRFGLNKYYSS